MTYFIQFDDYSEKWMVVDENGNAIMFSTTKEGAERIRDDFNEL